MEFKKNQSIYLQIVDFVRENIMTGTFPAGVKISSVREMAAQIGVNPNTVMRSYTQLQDSEIIYNKRGVGFFVNEKAADKIRKKMKSDFLSNELPAIIKKMKMLDVDISELERMMEKCE